MKWSSKITKVEANYLLTRGYKLEDLIGNIPYPHIVYLLWKGELPSQEHGKMIDSVFTACVDHGMTPPSSIASRTVASGGVPLPAAVAAGILAIGDVHGGAIEKGAKLLQDGISLMKKEKKTVGDIAKIIVTEAVKENKRIPGFGHRVHTSDPRSKRLFSLAKELKIAGDHMALTESIEVELEKSSGKKLPINVDGAIAAIISDMSFDWRLGKAFFLIGRVAGLTAHVYEEQTEQKPMRKMFSLECEYDGPPERNIP